MERQLNTFTTYATCSEQRSIKAHIGRKRSYLSINEFVVVSEENYHTGPVLAFAEVSLL